MSERIEVILRTPDGFSKVVYIDPGLQPAEVVNHLPVAIERLKDAYLADQRQKQVA